MNPEKMFCKGNTLAYNCQCRTKIFSTSSIRLIKVPFCQYLPQMMSAVGIIFDLLVTLKLKSIVCLEKLSLG